MSSLKADFEELRQRIRHGRELTHASFEPIYYLVFHPEKMLDVKRQTKAWCAKLKHDGWDVHMFSMAEAIEDILKNHKLRKVFLNSEKANPLDWRNINKTLSEALKEGDALQNRLEERLRKLEGEKHALLVVTDLEALHPYLRIGAIERRLQGKFHVPTIFLYPGTRTGKTRLRFLGFYPDDGNYRSVHVGG